MFQAMEERPSTDGHSSVGGQAVIEGVMIRAAHRIVTVVRRSGGDMVVREEEYTPLSKRYKLLNLPVVRGAVSFFEMLVIGIKTLNYSADIAIQEERQRTSSKRPKQDDRFAAVLLGATVFFSLALGLGIFFFLPLFIVGLFGIERDALTFNMFAGMIRIGLFLIYLSVISKWKEISRIFEYHGAEHKSIFAFEAGETLTVENVKKYKTMHPRCGTSFLLVVVVLAILIFSIADTAFVYVVGHRQNLLERFATHLCFLPVIAGISYELLKLSGKRRDRKLTRILIAPGLWLQKITTKEPDDEQLEVALVALRGALGEANPAASSQQNRE